MGFVLFGLLVVKLNQGILIKNGKFLPIFCETGLVMGHYSEKEYSRWGCKNVTCNLPSRGCSLQDNQSDRLSPSSSSGSSRRERTLQPPYFLVQFAKSREFLRKLERLYGHWFWERFARPSLFSLQFKETQVLFSVVIFFLKILHY